MWAINKSPLMIGAPAQASITPADSLDVLSNTEVIAINQDALGRQAQLVRRYTEEEWDIWAGPLSDSRMVVGIANWGGAEQTVEFDLNAVNVSSASARDVWAASDLGTLSGVQSLQLSGHELRLLVLSNIEDSSAPQSTGYHSAADATVAGEASSVSCAADECLPANVKIGNIVGTSSTATFDGVTTTSAGTKLVGVDFINYDVALDSAWDNGSNTRNMTIAVNGGSPKRWAFPISGGDWYDTGRMMVEVDGFANGENTVEFSAYGSNAYAPDLVGFEVFE